MTDEQRKAIIDRISKLSAVANPDSNAFQNEMSIASRKIAELMDKYSITWAEIHAKQVETSRSELKDAFDGKRSDYVVKGVQAWHWRLAAIIAYITNTKQYSSGSARYGTHMCFFGAEGNNDVAAALFTQWVVTIEAMAQKAALDNVNMLVRKYGLRPKFREWVRMEHPDEDPKFFRTSWISGCLSAMSENARNMRKEQPAEVHNALVVYQADMLAKYKEFSLGFRKISIGGSSGSSSAGYAAGYAAGKNMHVGQKGIGTSGGKLLKG